MDKELAEGCSQRAVVNGPVSEWRAGTSGVSQGLGFRLMLFNIFVSDMD